MMKHKSKWLFSLLILFSSTCFAELPVFDIAGFRNTLATSLNSATQIRNQMEQIKWSIERVKQTSKSLKNLDVNSLNELNDLLNGNTYEINQFLSSVEGIGYSLNEIASEYNRIFPGENIDKELNLGAYKEYYRSWNTQLSLAARESMRSQSVIRHVGEQNIAAAQILSRSKNAEGQMGMLESMMESLTLISNQLSNLTQVMVTNSRTMSVAAAAESSNQAAERTASERFWDGYGDMGKPPKRLNRLPDFK